MGMYRRRSTQNTRTLYIRPECAGDNGADPKHAKRKNSAVSTDTIDEQQLPPEQGDESPDVEDETSRFKRQLHLRGWKRKTGLSVTAVLVVLSILGMQLMAVQAGLEEPTPEAIAAAATDSRTESPPPPIDSYDSITVPVEDNVSVSVHLRESAGATQNLFLVHGAGGGAWVWEEYFDIVPENVNLYAVSWRGHFTSSPVEDANTTDYVADQLAAIDAIQERNDLPIHVVGHSYGGATTVLATAQSPDDVSSVSLLAPVVPLDYNFVQAALVPVVAPIFINGTADKIESAIEKGEGPTGPYEDMFLDQAQRDRYWDLYAGKPFSIEKEGLIAGDGVSSGWQDKLDDAYKTIGDAAIPTQFMVSPYDNVQSHDEQIETAESIDAPVIELESGHYIPLDVSVEQSIDLVLEHIG